MAPRKDTDTDTAPPPAREGGVGPAALAVKAKARAAGNLDKLSPGDPGYGGRTIAAPQGKGLRVEAEKGFQLSTEHDPQELVRVFDAHPDNKDEDIVLFSGTRKQLQKVVEQGQKFLKK